MVPLFDIIKKVRASGPADPLPRECWGHHAGHLQLVILEGWCKRRQLSWYPYFISLRKCGPADLRTTTQQDVGSNDDTTVM